MTTTIRQRKTLSLTRRARELYPSNRALAVRWVLAIRNLRRGDTSRWILDGYKPKWGN